VDPLRAKGVWFTRQRALAQIRADSNIIGGQLSIGPASNNVY
jgi:hypothetical protein